MKLVLFFFVTFFISSSSSSLPASRPQNRLFISPAVEDLLNKVEFNDTDVKTIFQNCLPSTLDSTVLWTNFMDPLNPLKDEEEPLSFIITGDIPALWLRDSTYQINPYIKLMKEDPNLELLVLGLINMHTQRILEYPYANAFFDPRNETNEPNKWAKDDLVSPPYDNKTVFEAKYELDSLASFLYLATEYFEETQNFEFAKSLKYQEAVQTVVDLFKDQQQGHFDVLSSPPFNFTRPTNMQSETQNLNGISNPVNTCGLIRSFFRPSDDSTIFNYLIPSNAMAVVGLEGVSSILEKAGVAKDLSNQMKELAAQVRTAIDKWGIVELNDGTKVYAFEVDCYGSRLIMDDANFPSLLSLPKFKFVSADDEVYKNTRKMILDPLRNPFYFDGKYPGIGSPHTGLENVWHMAVAMQAMTSSDKDEVLRIIAQLRDTTGGTGFMHEGYNVNDPKSFTRSWFAWANTVFGDLILHVYNENKTWLIEIPSSSTSS